MGRTETIVKAQKLKDRWIERIYNLAQRQSGAVSRDQLEEIAHEEGPASMAALYQALDSPHICGYLYCSTENGGIARRDGPFEVQLGPRRERLYVLNGTSFNERGKEFEGDLPAEVAHHVGAPVDRVRSLFSLAGSRRGDQRRDHAAGRVGKILREITQF